MFEFIKRKICTRSLENKLNDMGNPEKCLSKFIIKDLIQIMKEYNKLYGRPVDTDIKSDELVGFNMDDKYDIFYKNVHIHYVNTSEKMILRISIKQDDDTWRIGDTFSEDNDTMEVYLTYDIGVLGGKRCLNTIINNGTWDEYVLDTLNEMETIIYGYTRESKFNKAYNHTSHKSMSGTAAK